MGRPGVEAVVVMVAVRAGAGVDLVRGAGRCRGIGVAPVARFGRPWVWNSGDEDKEDVAEEEEEVNVLPICGRICVG